MEGRINDKRIAVEPVKLIELYSGLLFSVHIVSE